MTMLAKIAVFLWSGVVTLVIDRVVARGARKIKDFKRCITGGDSWYELKRQRSLTQQSGESDRSLFDQLSCDQAEELESESKLQESE